MWNFLRRTEVTPPGAAAKGCGTDRHTAGTGRESRRTGRRTSRGRTDPRRTGLLRRPLHDSLDAQHAGRPPPYRQDRRTGGEAVHTV
ncbi:hypothetical protein GCM10010273_19230 [Streptomyces lavendulocolor]